MMNTWKSILPYISAVLILVGCTSPVDSDSKKSGQQSGNNLTHADVAIFTSLEQALPAHTSQDQIIQHLAYTLKYNEEYEQAEWVAYQLTSTHLNGNISRTDEFRSDAAVTTGSATLDDYKGSGYDRGHLAPAADMKWSPQAMSESFFLSNMSPQVPGFNRGIWSSLESCVRTWAAENGEVFVVTGPVLRSGLPTIGPNKVGVPEFYYKVVLDCKEPVLKGIGFIMANASSSQPLQNDAVTIDSVESFTGIDFFPDLPDSLEKGIESTVDVKQWTFARAYKRSNVGEAHVGFVTHSNSDVIVFITSSGKKYHKEGCRYLSKSKNPVSLEDARAKGFLPCSVCKPPQ